MNIQNYWRIPKGKVFKRFCKTYSWDRETKITKINQQVRWLWLLWSLGNDASPVKKTTKTVSENIIASMWRNRLACLAVNRKVGGSSPPRDVDLFMMRCVVAENNIWLLIVSFCPFLVCAWFVIYNDNHIKYKSCILRGYCISYQKLACFVLYLKIINKFLKN